jgi:hypothetical protein
MQDFRRQATVALEVYLQRGLTALENLDLRNYEAFDAAIQRRVAAFHNFRAADELAKRTGFDISRDEFSRDVWKRIAEVDRRIEAAILSLKAKLERDATVLRNARSKISKYRSSTNQDSEFQQII